MSLTYKSHSATYNGYNVTLEDGDYVDNRTVETYEIASFITEEGDEYLLLQAQNEDEDGMYYDFDLIEEDKLISILKALSDD